MDSQWLPPIEIQVHGQITSVFEQFNPRKTWAKPHVKGLPIPGTTQRRAEAFGSMSQKSDARQTGQAITLPQDQVGVQMADNGLFDLTQPTLNLWLLPQKRQGGGIVTKQNNALA